MGKLVSNHAFSRIDTRLVGDSERAKVVEMVKQALKDNPYGGDMAVITQNIGGQRGQAWGQQSNGNLVVAIVRNRQVKTVMLRRSSQTHTRNSYRVQMVVRYA